VESATVVVNRGAKVGIISFHARVKIIFFY